MGKLFFTNSLTEGLPHSRVGFSEQKGFNRLKTIPLSIFDLLSPFFNDE
jgi:hypothetical protein